MPAPAPGRLDGAGYRRRTPESTLLCRVVAAELDGLRDELAARSPYGTGLPKHVEKDLEAFLKCGILAHVY